MNPFNISQLLQGHLTPTPPLQKAPNMMAPSTLHDQTYSSMPPTQFAPTQTSSDLTPEYNLRRSSVSQSNYGPLFDFEIDL